MNTKWYWLFLSFNCLVACTLIQEPSVEGETVEVIVPRDGLHSEIATQLFFWYHVNGAIDYELQLVTPSFNRIDRFLLDTLVSGDKFEYTLLPGEYEWRIRALNFSSSTPFTYHKLFIDSTSDLSNQQLILQTPATRDTTAATTLNFSWLPLYNAEEYELELWSPAIGQNRIFNQSTITPEFSYALSATGAFEWRVRAKNEGSASMYESRNFYVDRTAPTAPLLSTPQNNAQVTGDTVYFSWLRDQSGGSSIRDTLYLATDSTFTQLSKYYSKGTRLDLSGVPSGSFFWKLKSRDKAGNSSAFSLTRRFTRP
jgi:hypothetical protein